MATDRLTTAQKEVLVRLRDDTFCTCRQHAAVRALVRAEVA